MAPRSSNRLPQLENFASRSEAMQRCLDLARAAARTSAAVLIAGESGTGKRTLAEAIHRASSRAAAPCLAVDCATAPVEKELFGAEGAAEGPGGKLSLAAGGTLILEEIGAAPADAQARLVHRLEQAEGGDVRLIATVRGDLRALVEEGSFREDLFYRLRELALHLPPLRERREDLRELVDAAIAECNEQFGKKVGGVSQIVLDTLLRHDFPGNLREMRALVKRAVAVAKGDQLWLDDLGIRIEVPGEADAGLDPEAAYSLAFAEKRHIQHVLEFTHGNKKRASELLRISRPTLDRKIREYSLRVP